ncbi:hypothetical protein H0H93_011007, partial [Arthromyces matolae]
LPVIIKNNVATELGITNGQEATVFGWKEGVGNFGQRIIETLFVNLVNPPTDVQFEGLPKNVVPLSRTSVNVQCQLPDDKTLHVMRSQVDVQINFAMTDFASQAYYTALSRSASAAGTIIIGAFDKQKITGRASSSLRQEFRDLEFLDEISKLRYLGKLPENMYDAPRRCDLIAAFRETQSTAYTPPHLHRALKWTPRDPYVVESEVEHEWRILGPESTKPTNPEAKDAVALGTECNLPSQSLKRKCSSPQNRVDSKNAFTDEAFTETFTQAPVGPKWANNSCAYDSVLSIIYNMWLPLSRRDKFTLDTRAETLLKWQVENGSLDISAARERLRLRMHSADAFKYPIVLAA